jgi:hypothetical protein
MPNAFAKTLARKHSHDASHKPHKDPCLASLPKNCHAWTLEDVQKWIKSIQMEKFCELFDDIDGEALSEPGSEHGAFDSWLLDYGVDNLLERKRFVHSWEAYLHRWRFTATANPFSMSSKMSKQHSKISMKWQTAGARTVQSDRIEHLLTGKKRYSSQRSCPLKTEIAGDYDNYLDLLDLDLETSVRGRTKHKMEEMTPKEIMDRKKHIKGNYSGTNRHISNKSRAAAAARKQQRAQQVISPSYRQQGNRSTPFTNQLMAGSPPRFQSWKEKGKYIDVAHWKTELIGNKRLYMPQGTVSTPDCK